MNMLISLLTIGLFNQVAGHLQPYRPFQRSSADQQPKSATTPVNTIIDQFNVKPKTLSEPKFDHNVSPNVEGNDGDEIVGLGGLLRLHTLKARAKAHGAAAHARARLHLHRRPHRLLQATPAEFLNDDDNFHVTDSTSSKIMQQSTNQESISRSSNVPQEGFKNIKMDFVPVQSHETRERSAENYENQPTYSNQPEIYIHNIDNSAEVYHNFKPGFSIIPVSWKPPPESNLYVQGEYENNYGQEPILAFLPGHWTNNHGYNNPQYLNDYDIIPTTYNIPDPNDYGRSSNLESEEDDEDSAPEKFTRVTEQLQDLERDSLNFHQERSAEASGARHFHRPHSHTYIHQHIYNPSKVSPAHSTGYQHQTQILHSHVIPTQQTSGYNNFQTPTHQSAFSQSHSQSSEFSQAHVPQTHQIPAQQASFGHAQSSGFDIHSSGINQPQFPLHGHQITINKQKTTVVVPSTSSQNIQIAQVAGNNNAVSQSQHSNQAAHHGSQVNTFNPGGNFQNAQVSGNHNAVSQSQGSSSQAPFVSRSADGFVGAPYIIQFPRKSSQGWSTYDQIYKRSLDSNNFDIKNITNNILLSQSNLLKDIHKSAKEDQDVLFLTNLGSDLLDDLIEQTHKVKKRSVPLLRLLVDPNAKLDVPKTLDNMGTVMRNSFENKRTPGYHLKNLVGSARDVLLSAIRIPPQDLFVSSKYKIIDRQSENAIKKDVKREDARESLLRRRLRAKSEISPPMEGPSDPNSMDTYQRVGSMLSESVKSGRETLGHVGEMFHSARKAIATTRHVAPRVLLSSMRIPAVQRHGLFSPKKDNIMVLAPKIIQTKQETVGAPRYGDDFVSIGHVMNSLGISKPDVEKVGMRRIVLHPPNTGLLENSPLLGSRSNFVEDNAKRHFLLDDPDLHETLDALENAREAIGAPTLKDFVLQMRSELSSIYKNSLKEAKEKIIVNEEIASSSASVASSPSEETVGAGLPLARQLLRPFMGQPSQMERRRFFEEYGDSVETSEETTEVNMVDTKNQTNQEITGAINPMLFDKNFIMPENKSPFEFLKGKNVSVVFNDTESTTKVKEVTEGFDSTTALVESTTEYNTEGTTGITLEATVESGITEKETLVDNVIGNATQSKNMENATTAVGISMKFGKKLLTPFMGKTKKEEVGNDYDVYDDGYDSDFDDDFGYLEQMQTNS